MDFPGSTAGKETCLPEHFCVKLFIHKLLGIEVQLEYEFGEVQISVKFRAFGH